MRTNEERKREERKLILAHRRAWMDELAAEYPVRSEAARVVKMDRTSLVRMGVECGHKWPRSGAKPKPVKVPEVELNDAQKADVRLMIDSGYTKAEAVAIVTAPRVKVSARLDRIPSAQPRSEAPEARKAFPRMTSAASMKRPCAGENMGAMR